MFSMKQAQRKPYLSDDIVTVAHTPTEEQYILQKAEEQYEEKELEEKRVQSIQNRAKQSLVQQEEKNKVRNVPEESPLQNQVSADKKITFGGQCKKNEDCKASSWCCSGGRCVPGSTCFHGSKIINDFCENNYECLSRCCPVEISQCSKFDKCAMKCTKNDDCIGDNCCSFGWCSSKTVCDGRKEIGDLCLSKSECISHNCYKDDIAKNWGKNSTQMDNAKNKMTDISYKYPSYEKHPSAGICQIKEDDGPFEPMTIIQVFIVMFALVVIAIALYYFCRQWSRRTENNVQVHANRAAQNYGGSSNQSDQDSQGRSRVKRSRGESNRSRSQQRSDRSDHSSERASSDRRYGSTRKHNRQFQTQNMSKDPLQYINRNQKSKNNEEYKLQRQVSGTSTSLSARSSNSNGQKKSSTSSQSDKHYHATGSHHRRTKGQHKYSSMQYQESGANKMDIQRGMQQSTTTASKIYYSSEQNTNKLQSINSADLQPQIMQLN